MLFLSCGQNTAFGEPRWAKEVELKLRELGFDVFYAVEKQNVHSLTENIFSELREADYYLFIDFKREEIVRRSTRQKTPRSKRRKVFRGSLFSHQEFAIACFEGMEVLAFREYGVEPLTGVISAVMANATTFRRRSELAALVYERVKHKVESREWSTTSRNRLEIFASVDNGNIDTQTGAGGVRRVSHYHINAKNLPHKKAATNCFAYIDEILDAKTGTRVGSNYTCELKWEGTVLQGVRIGPKSQRGIDSFIVVHGPQGQELHFQPQTDAHNHVSVFRPGAELLVTYVVTSAEFAAARQRFMIKFTGLDKVVRVVPG